MSNSNLSDSELVAAALGGSRDAFGVLVERHQQIICALAYARTGSLAASEDIAQETFLAAWRNLARIRTPENLRGWLCGTARHLSLKFHRADRRSAPLREDLTDPENVAPSEAAISREEEALLWATLEQLPETYREPLILFHRSGQSVREIAEALELSEEAVKQRLSRGRALLQDAVRSKVESVLARSRPTAAFSQTVLAAIPAVGGSAKAAGAGLVMAKGAGTLAVSALLPAMGGGLFGVAGAWLGMRRALEEAESARERRFVKRVALWTMSTTVFFTGCMGALLFWSRSMQTYHPGLWIFLMAANVLSFFAVAGGFTVLNNRRQQHLREEERLKRGAPSTGAAAGLFEYRSRICPLGLPLIHVRLGGAGGAGIAMGWIAIGNVAIAPLAAFGGVAVGGLGVGGISLGIFVTAGIGAGLFSFSGLALGGLAIGGLAFGWLACGGAAWGWLGALGGLAWGGTYAMGHHVSAPHANDAAAQAFFQNHGLSSGLQWIANYGVWAQLALISAYSLSLFWLRKRARGGSR